METGEKLTINDASKTTLLGEADYSVNKTFGKVQLKIFILTVLILIN